MQNISPLKRLIEIQESPKQKRTFDQVNKYLENEEFITVVEEIGSERVYSITELGEIVLSKINESKQS